MRDLPPRVSTRTNGLLRATVWLLTASTVALLLAAPVASAWGLRPVVIAGGSMSPTINRGDVLVIGHPAERLVPGDLAVVGEGAERYVHRVIESHADTLLLKGDANAEPDLGRVHARDVTGRVVWHVGGPLALAAAASLSTEGRIALSSAAFALVLTATALLPAPVRSQRGRPNATDDEDDEEAGAAPSRPPAEQSS